LFKIALLLKFSGTVKLQY